MALTAQNNDKAILLRLLLEISEQDNIISNNAISGDTTPKSKSYLQLYQDKLAKAGILNDELIQYITSKTQIISESHDAWKLFNKAKEVLPNGERLENLSWRIMNYRRGYQTNLLNIKNITTPALSILNNNNAMDYTISNNIPKVPTVANDKINFTLPLDTKKRTTQYNKLPPLSSLVSLKVFFYHFI